MTKAELVFIPTPGMGHLISTIEFAKLLVKNNQNISILIINFDMPTFNFTAIKTYIESQSLQLDPTCFTFLTLPPPSNLSDPSSNSFEHQNINEIQKSFIKQALATRTSKHVAFVLDVMCINMIDVAKEMGIPSYIYFTAGACFLNLVLRFHEFDGIASESNIDLDLPGFRNRVPLNVLSWVFGNKESGRSSMIHGLSRRIRDSKGILVNTFSELESYALASLNSLEVPSVYPVGPVLALDVHNHGDGPQKEAGDSIMQWLEKQPPYSVVFLCFGSMGSFDEEQVKEIANGLERSGHRFLWSLRRPTSLKTVDFPSENETFEDALPEGFLDRTSHIGKIIGWAPQAQILAHPSIGGFVSHCGWNSILESIWCGVPIATWPIYSEQQLNAFELVKELELGVEITMDYRKDFVKNKGNFIVKAEEVEIGVNKLMSMDDQLRKRIHEMSAKSRLCLESGNDSHLWLTRFITEVLDS